MFRTLIYFKEYVCILKDYGSICMLYSGTVILCWIIGYMKDEKYVTT